MLIRKANKHKARRQHGLTPHTLSGTTFGKVAERRVQYLPKVLLVPCQQLLTGLGIELCLNYNNFGLISKGKKW